MGGRWRAAGAVLAVMVLGTGGVASAASSPSPSGGAAPSGTTVSSDDGKLTIEIPDGALPAGVEVTATFHGSADGAPEAEPLESPGFYRLEPSGTTFALPVRLSLRLTADELGIDPGVDGLPLMVNATRADDGSWDWLANMQAV